MAEPAPPAARAEALLTQRLTPERLARASSWPVSEIRSLWEELRSEAWPPLTLAAADWRDARAEIVRLFSLAGRVLVPLPLRDLIVFGPLLHALAHGPDNVGGGRFAVLAVPAGDQRSPSFDGSTLTAVCELVPFADVASAFVVPVRGEDGLVVSVVDAAAPGIALAARSTYDICSRPMRVSFDAAPVVTVLEHSAAQTWWSQITAAGRLAVAAETSGVLASCTSQAVDYARQRVQFDRPIGSFQAIQHLLAGITSKAYTLDALCEEAAACAPETATRMATSAKAYAAEVSLEVVEGALQAHGAIGYTQERPLHLSLKRVITLNATLGVTRQLRREVGMQRLSEARGSHE